jgi:hypothetical protein
MPLNSPGIARRKGKTIVVSACEPLDVLQSVAMLLRQLRAEEAKVENQVPARGSVGGQSRRAPGHGGTLHAGQLLSTRRTRLPAIP